MKQRIFIRQTHKKARAALELKPTEPGETFSILSAISIESSWIVAFTKIEEYNFILKIARENKKIELYTDLQILMMSLHSKN